VTNQRLLSVDANLTIDIDDERVSIRGDGSSVVVEVPSIPRALQMIRQLGPLKTGSIRLRDLSNWLRRVGLTVVLRTPRRRLVTLGCSTTSWVCQLFGIPNARVHLS